MFVDFIGASKVYPGNAFGSLIASPNLAGGNVVGSVPRCVAGTASCVDLASFEERVAKRVAMRRIAARPRAASPARRMGRPVSHPMRAFLPTARSGVRQARRFDRNYRGESASQPDIVHSRPAIHESRLEERCAIFLDAKLRFPAATWSGRSSGAEQSFAECVPKRSLGTR